MVTYGLKMISSTRVIIPTGRKFGRIHQMISNDHPLLRPSKERFSTSSNLNIREIKLSETPDAKTGKRNITVEGIVTENSGNIIAVPTFNKANNCDNVSEGCHPLCRFNFVHEIKHTDILILRQFMDNAGKVINRDVTGLCRRQHIRISKLIKMAAKAGLFPADKDMFKNEKQIVPGARFNSYWDECSIDAQHNELERKAKIRDFKT